MLEPPRLLALRADEPDCPPPNALFDFAAGFAPEDGREGPAVPGRLLPGTEGAGVGRAAGRAAAGLAPPAPPGRAPVPAWPARPGPAPPAATPLPLLPPW